MLFNTRENNRASTFGFSFIILIGYKFEQNTREMMRKYYIRGIHTSSVREEKKTKKYKTTEIGGYLTKEPFIILNDLRKLDIAGINSSH